jgi:fatty acid synthase
MCCELLEASPIFHASITRSAAVLKKEAKFDLLDAFEHEEGWNDPLAGALGLTAIQIGLVDLLKEEYGITPAGVLGHSAGLSPQ